MQGGEPPRAQAMVRMSPAVWRTELSPVTGQRGGQPDAGAPTPPPRGLEAGVTTVSFCAAVYSSSTDALRPHTPQDSKNGVLGNVAESGRESPQTTQVLGSILSLCLGKRKLQIPLKTPGKSGTGEGTYPTCRWKLSLAPMRGVCLPPLISHSPAIIQWGGEKDRGETAPRRRPPFFHCPEAIKSSRWQTWRLPRPQLIGVSP